MKKNKKLFAILTLVAFMMTLMPVMAFAAAADGNAFTIDSRTFTATGDMEINVTKDANDTIQVYALNTTDPANFGAAYGTAAIANNTTDKVVITKAKIVPGTYTIASSTTSGGPWAITDALASATNKQTFTITKEDVTRSYHAIYMKDASSKLDADKASDFVVAYRAAEVASCAADYNQAVAILSANAQTEGAKLDLVSTPLAAGDTISTKISGAGIASLYAAKYKAATGDIASYISPAGSVISGAPAILTGNVVIELTNTKTNDAYTVTVAAKMNPSATSNVAEEKAALEAEGTINITDKASGNYILKGNFATAPKVYAYTGLTSIPTISGSGNTTQLSVAPTTTAQSGTVTFLLSDNKTTVTVPVTVVSTSGDGSGSTNTSVDASIIATKDENASVEAESTASVKSGVFYYNVDGVSTIMPDTKYAEIELVLRQANNASISGTQTVYVWAEESGKSRQATDALVLNTGNQTTATPNQNVYKMTLGSVSTIQAAFVRAGSYTIKAAIVDPTTNMENGLLASNTATFKTVTNKNTITATALAQETRLFTVGVASGANAETVIATALADGDKTTKNVQVSANTVATTKVTLTVKNKKGTLMGTYPLKLSTNSANIELDKTSVTTDYKGEATFNIAGLREGEYKVYLNIGDYEATINVTVGATSANNIELIKFPSNPIATDTMVSDYNDIFRFQLTDANGNIVKDTYKGAEYAALVATDGTSSSDQAKYASIVSAPEANKVKNADLKLKYVTGKDYYTLDVDNNKSFSAEGNYTIRVVLNNGKSATLDFSVKKFDTATSLHIEYPTSAVELNSKTDAPDIYFLDASNVMKKANNRVTVAASGYAVAGVVESGSEAGTITVKNDEKYIGQTITVTAASDKENLMATTTLTVADEAREVKLDTTKGAVNANNRVGFKVIDSTGKAVALGNDATVDVTAVVTNTGDADAKVSYSVSGSSKADLKSNGTGVINLSSNKETTATVQIMVKVSKPQTNANDNNTGLSTTYYTGTETFTFGAEADKSVVMTIGSNEIVANNVPTSIDVAPFIQDNRTWVPFRALVEAFGAEVEYNAENNTVTTKLAGKTVVMTVGSNVMTVNDEAVTMDVAPFIVDDRVVVPVRFVGEAFGFTVEAIADATTGATASVVFYQK